MKKKLLTLFMASITSIACLSQNTNENPPSEQTFSYVPTPQTSAFIRYGSNPVEHYTGSVSVQIPVYTYSDNDFTLPISVNYSSQGLMPGRQTGILGMNWFLNCAGAVSREIKGIADDHESNDGMLGILLGSGTYDEADALNITKGGLDTESMQQYLIDRRETTSDIYHFNFAGHSGTFHFDGAKQIHIYNTNGNHGTYTIAPIKPANKELCGFTITTGDGYEYTFGSATDTTRRKSVERSLGGRLTGVSVFTFNKPGLENNPIVTWNLTGITAPNGRHVTIEYANVDHDIASFIKANSNNNPFLVTTFSNGFNVTDELRVDHLRNVSMVHTSYLSRIIIDKGTEIKFALSLKGCNDRPETPVTVSGIEDDHCITQELMKLDSISVINHDGEKVQGTDFTYKIKDNRLLLRKIHIQGVGDYTMNYHEEEPYPAISTADTDFWGFYNGKGNSYSTVMASGVNTNYNDYISSSAKNPDWRYSRLGCLKTITYPTHGFSTFEYEANRATDIILKRKFGNADVAPLPDESAGNQGDNEEDMVAYLADIHPYSVLFQQNDETGGVRILRTVDYDNHQGHISRTYSYSGGTVYTFPKFYTASVGSWQVYNSQLEYPSNTLDKQHIGYSTVRESYSDGSHIVYRYNDYRTHPDEYEGQTHKKYPYFGDSEYLYTPAFVNNILREPNSNHAKRGKIKDIRYYDSDSMLVKESIYEYAMHDSTYTAYIVMSGKYANSVKRYTGDYRLTSQSTTEYFAGTPLTTLMQFTYDSRGRNIRTSTTYPDASDMHIDTEYLSDNGRGIYTLPTRVSRKQHTQGKAGLLVQLTEYSYPTSGSVRIPDIIREANIDAETPADISPASLIYTTIHRVADRDSIGNPTEIIDRHGVHTAFLWGYKGLYPVAQARNTTAAMLKSLVQIGEEKQFLTAEERTNLYSIPGSLVEIYEHKPLVGITAHYDNKGYCTSYEYDTYGRLTGVSDEKGYLQRHRYIQGCTTTIFAPQLPTLGTDLITK